LEAKTVNSVYDNYIHENEDGKFVIIEFDKIFNEDGISHMNEFSLKKRSYYTINNLITDSIKRVFSSCQEKVILPYLQIAYKIKNLEEEYTKEDMINDIVTVVNNKSVKRFVNEFINSNYVEELDEQTEETKKTKKINQELQFTDEHVKILLKAAESIRLSIPLITEFCEKRKHEVNDTLYDTFEAIIRLYQGKIEMMNKIHRFVYSRVVSTQYSDKTIWNLLTNKSKDVNVITIEFLKDIVIGILPKTITDKNIINLFHVVIKRKIIFEFSKNHKITFKPVNLNQVDREGLTMFDKWEASMSKRDESKIIINQLSIQHQIENIQSEFKIKISQSEFAYYKNHIHINKFQTNLLFLFFAKYMGSYSNLYNCNRDEYIYLVILLYKWLKMNGYNCIAEYIIALPDRLNEKRMTTKNSKLFEKITESKTYKDLIRNKYNYISQNIIQSKLIIKLVGNISVSKYNYLTPFEEYNPNEVVEPEEIICRVDDLADEILNFIKLI